nr:EpsG family protein [Halomonas campaniensis]
MAGLPLIALHAFRENVGTDYNAYVWIYESFIDGASIFWFEPLYSLLNILANFLGGGVVLVFGVAALLSTLPIYVRIFRISHLPWLSFFILFGMSYPFFQTNGVRSAFAIALIFYATPFIWRKKLLPWILYVFLSAGFHYTAFIMIPFYWLLRLRLNVVFACFAFALAVLFSTNKAFSVYFLEFSSTILPSVYSHYPDRILGMLNDFKFGFGYGWYLISAIFVLFFWERLSRLCESAVVIRNSYFIGLLIMIAFYHFFAAGRLAWFFWISGILFWPLAASQLSGWNRAMLVSFIALMHFILFFYAMYVGSHDATPYNSIFH